MTWRIKMPAQTKPKDLNKTVKSNLAEQSRPSKQAQNAQQKLQNLIALEFEMALYYAQPWHGDLSNAIIKAEQALQHQCMLLKLQGKNKEDPSLDQFYHLLLTIYELKSKDFETPRFSSTVEPINQCIAESYKKLIKSSVDFTKFPNSLATLEGIFNPNIMDQTSKNALDTTKNLRAKFKDELSSKYYRGLGLNQPGFGANESLGPWTIADLHRQLAFSFLGQPDYSNAIIHAEFAKEMILTLQGNDETHPDMKNFYETLIHIYKNMPNKTEYAVEAKLYSDKLDKVKNISKPSRR